MTTYSLVQLNGTATGRSFKLDPNGPPVTIGRDSSREIPVNDHLCSRLHCRLWFDDGVWRVEDCASRNGTLVNSREVRDVVALRPGDALRIGSLLLVFIEQGKLPSGSGWQPALLESTTFVARVPSGEQKDAVIAKLKGNSDPDSNRNAEVLIRLVSELQRQDTVSDTLKMVREALKVGTRADAVIVWLTDSEGRLKRYGEQLDSDSAVPSPLARLVIDQQDAVLVQQPGQGSTLESTVVDELPGSAICVPIPFRSQCRGAIECLRNSLVDSLTDSNLELCIAVGRQSGLALENLEYRERIELANSQLRRESAGSNQLIGDSESIRHLLGQVSRVSSTQSTVLLHGESGTGKELVAKMIHDSSSQSSGPYVAINCAAFSESLLESELFGHEKGAFTGASSRYLGHFERAHLGTLFMDEIGEMSLNCQAKLLRVLDGHTFQRVGGKDNINVDVRIVSATHRRLDELVAQKKFREDLFYRLNVLPLHIPPLRERGDDVVLLANHFLRLFRQQNNDGPTRLSAATVELLREHAWPGNVRELRNSLERACVLGVGDEITPDDLGKVTSISTADIPKRPPSETENSPTESGQLQTLTDATLHHILKVVKDVGGNKMQACRILGIGRGTLYKKLKEIEERFGETP